ncbi:unnamed protein product [Prorocentrum cordatum]|uniref:Uncharacterized protein n=1 Tax=Prorocentrum cordatum TaxID=2364126 RepID=A0ABN9T905_9DINO|nr:unnamed protein product [Polarella glacialis]
MDLESSVRDSRLRGCCRARWLPVPQRDSLRAPSARSSFVLAPWPTAACGVLHGGLGNDGVMSDVWVLEPQGTWHEMPTSGALVSRAHHCGAVQGDLLLVHSGQDATFLTAHAVHSLDLSTGVWQELVYPSGPPSRIDAAAASVEGVGVLILGGVDTAFEFEPADLWLLGGTSGAGGSASCPVALPHARGAGPHPHACGGLAVRGLQVFAFGGFDGKNDSDELWRLDLAKCIV